MFYCSFVLAILACDLLCFCSFLILPSLRFHDATFVFGDTSPTFCFVIDFGTIANCQHKEATCPCNWRCFSLHCRSSWSQSHFEKLKWGWALIQRLEWIGGHVWGGHLAVAHCKILTFKGVAAMKPYTFKDAPTPLQCVTLSEIWLSSWALCWQQWYLCSSWRFWTQKQSDCYVAAASTTIASLAEVGMQALRVARVACCKATRATGRAAVGAFVAA